MLGEAILVGDEEQLDQWGRAQGQLNAVHTGHVAYPNCRARSVLQRPAHVATLAAPGAAEICIAASGAWPPKSCAMCCGRVCARH